MHLFNDQIFCIQVRFVPDATGLQLSWREVSDCLQREHLTSKQPSATRTGNTIYHNYINENVQT